ncbi:cytochrome P450 [Xylariaceae sp. FL0804]|nr:cytochrome P450 [Xylariaceae sp. FL0804]
MALSSSFWERGIGIMPFIGSQAFAVVFALAFAYLAARTVYNLYFHPLSKFPGPKVAAITDLWWAYASTTGKYPWMTEEVLKQHGNVVRIAPNELVFITPQAAKDIYLAQEKNLELFVQVGYDALDTGDGGISGETNPIRHREIAKRLSPAFSMRNFKAKEAAIQGHFDLFIKRMREFGDQGVEMQRWTDWLALDLAADMTYGRDMGHVRDMKDSTFLGSTLKLNLFLTLSQITRKFRLLSPLIYLTIPPRVWLSMPSLLRMNAEVIKGRMERRGKTEHLDYFEQLAPADQPPPEDKKHLYHLQNVAGQLLLASWQPLANQFYSLIFFLLREPDAYTALVQEIRTHFRDSKEMAVNTESTASLKYLQACVQESLRLHQETVDGLPRVSPGALVDGMYIPQGVTCQISYFAAARSARFFAEPLKFRPQRWLPPDHPRYEEKYRGDNLKASKPFSQGPRGCPGGAIAVTTIRLFIAMVLLEFDLEAGPGQHDLSFDRHFRFMTFWERPPFWVRFKSRKETAVE